MLDASDIFKTAHKLSRNKEKTDLFKRGQTCLETKVKEAVRTQNEKAAKGSRWDNQKLNKYVSCIVNATYGLRQGISTMNVRAGLERTGLFNTCNMTGISTIMRNFNRHLTTPEWICLKTDLEKALPQFIKYGQLTDEVIEDMEFVKQLVLHGEIQINVNHRDKRTLIQQRAVLLTHDATFKRRFEQIRIRDNHVTEAAERKLKRENAPVKVTKSVAVASSEDKKKPKKRRHTDRISSQQGSYDKVYSNKGSAKRTRCEGTRDEDMTSASSSK